jgi:hypothetical protein
VHCILDFIIMCGAHRAIASVRQPAALAEEANWESF